MHESLKTRLLEQEMWQQMASLANRLAKNPRDDAGGKLIEQTRTSLAGLQIKTQQQVAIADEQLSKAPYDMQCRRLLTASRERLEDLRFAEAILAMLSRPALSEN